MSFYRIPIEKDVTISTYSSLPTLVNLGNAGASQIVDVWAEYRDDKNYKYLTRFLGSANLTGLQAQIAAGTVPSISAAGVSTTLKFFNINHSDPEAFEFTLDVYPVSTAWSEGRGTRIDSFTNTGYANWVSASTSAAWVSTGGDFVVDANSASQYFSSGYEDLCVNISGMVNNWLNGTSANNGFLVKMDSTAESFGALSTNTQWYRKSFHGRLTNFPNYAPYISVEWVDLITDDRSIGKFGNSVSLYLYNDPNAIYGDVDGITTGWPGSVTLSASIQGVSGALSAYDGNATHNFPASSWTSIAGLVSITAGRVKTGIYKTTFILPSSATIFNSFSDVWSITSAASAAVSAISQVFTPQLPVTGDSSFIRRDTTLAVVGWPLQAQGYNSVINKDSINTWRVYLMERPASIVPLAQSEANSISSIAASTIPTFITTDGWYRILVDALGVVDVDWQKMGYDAVSNFFTLDMSNFSRGIQYDLEFKVNMRGQTMIFDKTNYKFIVE